MTTTTTTSANELILGIDLGTAHARVAAVSDGPSPAIVRGPLGEIAVPAVAGFARRRDGLPAIFLGTPARRQAVANPRHTVSGVKALLGRRAEEVPAGEGYLVVAGPGGAASVELEGKSTPPEEIAAHLLGMLRAAAEAAHGRPTSRPVLAVPAGWGHARREALRDAAEIAGLAVDRLIAAPTAAALALGLDQSAPARWAICDVGAGGFDLSLMSCGDGVIEVIAQSTDEQVSGDEIERRLLERLTAELTAATGVNPATDPSFLARLRDEVERVKHALSSEVQVVLQIAGPAGQPFVRALRRLEAEVWTKDIVDRLEPACRGTLDAAGLAPREIDHLVVLGGAARMPAMVRKLEILFGRAARREVERDDLVALGAARCGQMRAGRAPGVTVIEVCPRGLGVDAGGGQLATLIPRHSALPARELRIVPAQPGWRDGEGEVALDVYEGDFVDVSRDRCVGRLWVRGLPPGPAGQAMAVIELGLDVDGRVGATARELASGSRLEVRLDPARGLERAEVRRLAGARAKAMTAAVADGAQQAPVLT